jgi:hypothetical protein
MHLTGKDRLFPSWERVSPVFFKHCRLHFIKYKLCDVAMAVWSSQRPLNRLIVGSTPSVLVSVAGFNARLNWMNSCEWLNVFTNAGHLFIHSANKRSAFKTWNGTYEKLLEWTGTGEWTNNDKRLCIVTGGGLSIGKFYNIRKWQIFLVLWKQCNHVVCGLKRIGFSKLARGGGWRVNPGSFYFRFFALLF